MNEPVRKRRLRKPSKALLGRLDTAKAQDWRRKHFKRQGGKCFYCGRQLVLEPPNARNIATLDHVTPLSRGGAHHWENTVASCGPCNREKGASSAESFVARPSKDEVEP